MLTEGKRLTEWLAPIPEEDYLRIIYVGKLQIVSKRSDYCKNNNNSNFKSIEEMINDIWGVSRFSNKKYGISGHLAYTSECHVAQLIEGKADKINSLMAIIEKDSRILIYKVFRRKLQTMNLGWNISMCYSFQITSEQYQMIADCDVTPEQMFNNIKNTYEVRREGLKLCEFYKTVVDTFLLKYISIQENVKFKKY